MRFPDSCRDRNRRTGYSLSLFSTICSLLNSISSLNRVSPPPSFSFFSCLQATKTKLRAELWKRQSIEDGGLFIKYFAVLEKGRLDFYLKEKVSGKWKSIGFYSLYLCVVGN